MRCFLIGLCLCMLLPLSASAVGDAVGAKTRFAVREATLRFNTINQRIHRSSISMSDLNQQIDFLVAIMEESEACVERTDKKIKELTLQIKQYFGDGKPTNKGADLLYLEAQNKKIIEQRAACRLLFIKVQEVIDVSRKRVIDYQKTLTFTKGKPLWQRAALLPDNAHHLQWPSLTPSVKNGAYLWVIGTFLLLLVPVVLTSYYLAGKLHRASQPQKRQFYRIFIVMYFFLLSVIALPYMNTIFDEPSVVEAVTTLTANVGIILASLLGITMLFSIRQVADLFRWYGLNLRFVYQLLACLGGLLIAQNLVATSLQIISAPVNAVYFFESILLYVALGVTGYFALRFFATHRIFFTSWISPKMLLEFFAIISGSIIFIDAIGYHSLAMNIATLYFALLLSGLVAMFGWRGLHKLFLLVHYSPQSRLYLGRHLGHRSKPPYYELVILKWICIFVLCLGVVYLFVGMVGEQAYRVEEWLEYVVQGGYFAGYALKPLQWIIGLLVFSLLVLASNFVAARISKREQVDEAEEVQVALASIITYAGLALSVLMGLFIAGFSFTSLALIAGALSVGIGLGLQSIVNNFVSGIILLIEKPIKAGDRISVNGVEGFVKRVRVRSTQLVTPAKEDIIIPNSDLITHQVTNYMFSDSLWRVKCEVGVAYGSDVRLVEKTLMKVAYSHTEVQQTNTNKPRVLFHAFGDSALLFELWCMISDVNHKYRIASELNFAIEQAFREQNIVIAFPQQDVHLHWPKGKAPTQ